MARFQLILNFFSDDLKTMAAAEQKVDLLKSTNGKNPLAWIAFELNQDNLLQWEDNYGNLCF